MDNVNIVDNLLIKPLVQDHLDDQDEESRDDFIHEYLKEMRRRHQKQETTTLEYIQEKCFQEILVNVGQSRRPSIKEQTNLPYVEATIMEVLRYADIVPTGVPHAVAQDVQFRGYTFPKGVTVILNLDSVLQDTDVWGDPQNFRPDNCLDRAGKIQKRDEFIPFSLGRRVSLGEATARMELFLFLTTMIQRFKFVPVNGK
ncbi:putative inactive cytochrome P450 2G1 [Haliotis rubra]|uniref:putative inactive cytochrome P450 2G1 n=1 Tax=Haliotis rubra TaxID=36100 RepID=UPI001EE59DCE|nr:putative inactive cytochrome P450 2G1 [Haliotis rubra]